MAETCNYPVRTCRNCKTRLAGTEDKKNCYNCGELRKCSNAPMYPSTVCRIHGGGSIKKGTSPGRPPITGEYSKFPLIKMTNDKRVKLRLTDRVQEAMADPELVALRKPLALISLRVQDLIERLEQSEDPERWEKALDAFNDFALVYRGRGAAPDERKAYRRLSAIMEEAKNDYDAWQDIMKTIEVGRKLSESERKRLIQMKAVMTSEEVLEIAMSLLNAVIEETDDPIKLKRIQTKFIRIIGAGNIDNAGISQRETEFYRPSDLDSPQFLDTRTERPD